MIDGITEEELKYIRRWKFFNRGFYISLIIWTCGIAFSMIGGEVFNISPVIRLMSIFVPLGIYMFFVIGKDSTEKKVRGIIK